MKLSKSYFFWWLRPNTLPPKMFFEIKMLYGLDGITYEEHKRREAKRQALRADKVKALTKEIAETSPFPIDPSLGFEFTIIGSRGDRTKYFDTLIETLEAVVYENTQEYTIRNGGNVIFRQDVDIKEPSFKDYNPWAIYIDRDPNEPLDEIDKVNQYSRYVRDNYRSYWILHWRRYGRMQVACFEDYDRVIRFVQKHRLKSYIINKNYGFWTEEHNWKD